MFGEIFFYIVGIYAFLWWFIDNFKSLFQILWHSLVSILQPDMCLSEQFGHWAAVTGGTDGIGKEYAKQLAQRGINIVLIARNESKLINVSKEIETLYAVQTKYIVADFCKGKEIYDHIEQQLNELSVPIGILVNNAGIFYEYPEEFTKVSSDVNWNMVMTNLASMTMMTNILIKKMKEHKKGMIVNVSSGCSLTPSKYACLYAATKSFANFFSLGLQSELEPYGIKVQLLIPFVVNTKMVHYTKTKNIFTPDVETFCRWALFTLGKSCESTGYWAHAIQVAVMRTMPVRFRQIIMEKMARHYHNEYFATTAEHCTVDCQICYKKTDTNEYCTKSK